MTLPFTVNSQQSSVISHQLSVISYQLPVINWSLVTAHCSLLKLFTDLTQVNCRRISPPQSKFRGETEGRCCPNIKLGSQLPLTLKTLETRPSRGRG